MVGSGGRVFGGGGGLATPSNVSPLGGPVAEEASLLTLQPADEVVRPPRVLRREGDAEEDCLVTLYGYGTTSLFFPRGRTASQCHRWIAASCTCMLCRLFSYKGNGGSARMPTLV